MYSCNDTTMLPTFSRRGFLSFSLFLFVSHSPLVLPPFLYPSFPPPTPLPFSLAVRPLSRKMGLHFHRETTFAHYEVLRAKPRRPAEWRSRELTLNITRTSREPSVRTIFILSLSLCFSLFFSFFCLLLSSSLSCARMSVRSGAKISDIPLTFDVTTTMK